MACLEVGVWAAIVSALAIAAWAAAVPCYFVEHLLFPMCISRSEPTLPAFAPLWHWHAPVTLECVPQLGAAVFEHGAGNRSVASNALVPKGPFDELFFQGLPLGRALPLAGVDLTVSRIRGDIIQRIVFVAQNFAYGT